MNEEKEQNSIKYLKKEEEIDPRKRSKDFIGLPKNIKEGPSVQPRRLIVRGVSTISSSFNNRKQDFIANNIDTNDIDTQRYAKTAPRPIRETSYTEEEKDRINQFHTSHPHVEAGAKDSVSEVSLGFINDNILSQINTNDTNLNGRNNGPHFESKVYPELDLKDTIYIDKSNGTPNIEQPSLQVSYQKNEQDLINKSDEKNYIDRGENYYSTNVGQQETTSPKSPEEKSRISLSSLYSTHLNDQKADKKLEPIKIVERVVIKNNDNPEKKENFIIRIVKYFIFSILQFIGCLLFLILSIFFVLIIYINFL
ncbi:MAG: hypothetical protein N3A71_02730 [Candidatus Dojkabacteria bacterium]|nr:hypothetical protein [Candidatus Dojkabacteria bacterium]